MPRSMGSLGDDRVEVVTGDVPAALTQGDGHRSADQAEPGDVGAARRVGLCSRRHGPPGYRWRREAGRGIELADLVEQQLAPLPRRQLSVTQRADAHPHQALHGMADRLAHPPHLAVAALVDRDPQHARARLGHLRRRGRPVVQLDAVAQPAQRRRRRRCRATSATYSFSMPWLGWVSRLASSPSLVNKQQPLGVDVEPPDREDPRLGGHEVDDRRAALRVARRGDHTRAACSAGSRRGRAARRSGRRRRPPRRRRGRRAGRASATSPLTEHPPGGDQLLAVAPAADAALGEHLLQAGQPGVGAGGAFGRPLLPQRRLDRRRPSSVQTPGASPGSTRRPCSRASTTSAPGTNSAIGGRSASESRPSFSRNAGVVPYRIAWPGPLSRAISAT